jgi:hypothetical protein
MKLLINNYEAELNALAEEAIEIKVLIAFLTEAGLTWLPKNKYEISHFIVGVGLSITTVEALKALQNGNAEVRVFDDRKRLFHPKVIYMKTAKSEHLIVGSNNLTFGGISSNHEVSTLSERNALNDGAFSEFHRHFDCLRSLGCCYEPDAKFYREYRQVKIQNELARRIPPLRLSRRVGGNMREPSIAPAKLATLGEFIEWIAQEFQIAREFHKVGRNKWKKISHHPLMQFHKNKFRPLFKKIIQKVSGKRLTGLSHLIVASNWRIMPLIEALDQKKETGEEASHCGRTALQIHFRDGYSKVCFSFVLQYYVPISSGDGQMPNRVRQRFDRIIAKLKDYKSDAVKGNDLKCFKNWNYPKHKISDWSKPLLSYEYDIDSLPPDERLCDNLASLATALFCVA